MTCAFSSAYNFAHAQTLYRMRSLCRSSMVIWLYSWMYEYWSILCLVNIGILTGWKKIKQQRISFVLGYLRMILSNISTAISIKHRILATFNLKKKINLSDCMPLSGYLGQSSRNGMWYYILNTLLQFLVVTLYLFSDHT